MNDRTRLKFRATLVYDAETMHSGDRDIESRDWFLTEILGGEHLCLHDHGELDETIGSVEDFELVQDVDAAELRMANARLVYLLRVMLDDGWKSRFDLEEWRAEVHAALAATEGES